MRESTSRNQANGSTRHRVSWRKEGRRRAPYAPFRRRVPGVPGRGRLYHQKEPATLVRFVGHAPLEATVFEMERQRCNACGEVFTADEPEAAGPAKYDETAVAMIALLRSTVPECRI